MADIKSREFFLKENLFFETQAILFTFERVYFLKFVGPYTNFHIRPF